MKKMKTDALTTGKIAKFWTPLAATWLMMATEGPFIAAIIARLPEPKFNLAAYGVAFSFALIVESPIIMIMTASTALVKDRHSFQKLFRYTLFLNTAITLLMLISLMPEIFNFVTEVLIGLPPHIAKLTRTAALLLIPWPAAIGFRRFYQGILITHNKTRRIAFATVFRLVSMAVTATLLFEEHRLSGAAVGAISLSTGVVLESFVIRFMAGPYIRKLHKTYPVSTQLTLNYRFISIFYYPLALTSILALGVQPLVTFFMGHSRFPVESLAVLPVVTSLVFVFRSMGLSFQEVVIALMGENREGYRPLKRFTTILALTTSFLLGIIAFTPASHVWFRQISGLSEELANFAILPTRILVLMPALSVLISWQRANLVHVRQTAPITWATVIEISGIVLTLFISISYLNVPGVVAAASAFLIGRLAGNTWLAAPRNRAADLR
ncbi:MAG: hypothetical protein GXO70_12035 [Acidobacteria bacterium]|nr:hypothetical protein [Acidobacteriota bacterium]